MFLQVWGNKKWYWISIFLFWLWCSFFKSQVLTHFYFFLIITFNDFLNINMQTSSFFRWKENTDVTVKHEITKLLEPVIASRNFFINIAIFFTFTESSLLSVRERKPNRKICKVCKSENHRWTNINEQKTVKNLVPPH